MEWSTVVTLLVYMRILITFCSELNVENGFCTEIPDVVYAETDYQYGDEDEQTVHHINSISINCSFLNFTKRTLAFPPRIYQCASCPEILTIEFSSIPSVPPSFFVNYPSITVLNLTSNGIEDIMPGAFNMLTSLEELYLSKNDLSNIFDGIFNSLIKLRILDLSSNNIYNLTTNSLAGATNLEVLNLSSNILHFVDSYLFIHTKLFKEVDLSFNQLQVFNFTPISEKIHKLNLSNNELKSILGCFVSIIDLDLSSNLITTLGNSNCSNASASKIVRLDASHNAISNLEGFPDLNNIEYLYLQNNNLSFIHSGFFSKLNRLRFLNVSSNGLLKLQYGLLDGLSSLQVLDLSKNHLTVFKKFIYHLLRNLSELYLHDNEINLFDFKHMNVILPHLQKITLSGNNLTCETLVEVFHDLIHVKIYSGHLFNTSNINGIACSEPAYNSDLQIEQNADVSTTLDETFKSELMQLLKSDFANSSMYKYFNQDFTKSNFYRYLESLKLVGNMSISSNINNLEDANVIEKSNLKFSGTINSYFNNDFRNSNFVKYFENYKTSEELFNNSLSRVNNYFSKDFLNSNFYRYLETLKKPRFAMEYTGNSNNTRVEKLVSCWDKPDQSGNFLTALLVMITVLLAIILCTLLLFMYVSYKKLGKLVRNKYEQVELIEA